MRNSVKIVIAGFAAFCTLLCSGCAAANDNSKVVSYVATDSATQSELADLVEEVQDSVVCITTSSITTSWGQQYITSGAGSGVIIQSQKTDGGYSNYVITNNHVIDSVVGSNGITDGATLSVTTHANQTYAASIVGTDERGDIAVISYVSPEEEKTAKWGDSDKNRTGENVFAIGNPLGTLGGTVTAGIISSTARTITVNDYAMNLIQTDTAINPGNSGGALFNYSGELIGVVNAKTTDEEIEGICFAIPANDAKSIYTDLVRGGVVTGRCSFGFRLSTVSVNMGGGTVMCISSLTEGGAAKTAGLAINDRIVSINGINTDSALAYHNALASVKPGDSVKVVYQKAVQNWWSISWGESQEVTLTAAQTKLYERV